MGRFFAAFFLTLLLAGALSPTTALAQKKRLIYGYDKEYPPYSYEHDGRPDGFDVDILNAILEETNYLVVPQAMIWEELLLQLSGGNIQISSGMIQTRQRQLLYDFTDMPILPLKTRLFTKNYNRVGNLAQLRGKKASVKNGTIYQIYLEEFGGLVVKTYPTDREAITALYKDEVDAYCGADRTGYFLLRKLGMKGISPVGTPMSVTNVYYALHKGQPDLLAKLNSGLRSLRQTGEYDRLFRKWFVQDLSQDEQNGLIEAAKGARVTAYAPYSKQPEGAALLGRSGRIYTGANIENSNTELNAGALMVAVSNAVSSGESDFRAAVRVLDNDRVASPTSTSRRLLYEFGPEILVIDEPEPGMYVTRMVSELLPFPTREKIEGDILEKLWN